MREVYGQLGSVSVGTNLLSDLIPCFIELLDSLKEELSLSLESEDSVEAQQAVVERVARIDILLADVERNMKAPGYYESDGTMDAYFDYETICDELDSFAAPGCYFGAHIGDGADRGFWENEG